VMNQRVFRSGPVRPDRHLQGIQREVGSQRGSDPPADDGAFTIRRPVVVQLS
jgi:hypothetical protein